MQKNVFILLLALISALVISCPAFGQLQTNAPWPMYRQNVKHTGQTNEDVLGAQKNPFILWKYLTGGTIFDSSPAIGPDGTIYIGASDGVLYAINSDGSIKWSYSTGGDIYSSPAIGKDGTVYVGSTDNKVYAVSNGLLKWSFKTNNDFNSSPAIGTNGVIYIGNRNGYLYALTNGSIKWACNVNGPVNGSSPAISWDGTVYIGTTGDRLYAVTNGNVKWFTNLESDIVASPVIGKDNTIYVLTWEGRLYALTDNTTGVSGKWPYFDSFAGSAGYSSPAVDEYGTVYFGTYSMDTLYAVTNGAEKWSYISWDSIYTSPAVGSDGTVYFGGRDGSVYAITNGEEKWSLYADTTIDRSSPAIGNNGTIYFGAVNTVYAVRQENYPVLTWTSNTGYSNDGVNPNTNASGSIFNFEIKYSDMDHDYPKTREVWVDLNDNGTFDALEKFTMYSNSGTSYSNGVIFTRSIQAFNQGDGRLFYTFHFINQYNFTNTHITNTFLVTNAGAGHIVTVTKNWEGGNLFSSPTNQTVMAVQLWDSQGDTLTGFKVGNSGDLADSTHIRRVRLWFDQNSDYTWDGNDTFVSDLNWDGTEFWTNNSISFGTPLSFPNLNYIVTIDLETNSIHISNSFRAYIPQNGLTCSGAANGPSQAVTNIEPVLVGQFLFRNNIWPGLYLSSIALGDLDNDGDLDLVFIGNSGGDIYLRRAMNDGNGNFGTPILFGTKVHDGSVCMGDTDMDGDLDLIVTGYNAGWDRELLQYINPGNGAFNLPKNVGEGQGTIGGEVALADLNNDGALDIVLTGDGEQFVKYLNDGSGTFGGPLVIDGDIVSSSVVVGDLNNDGAADIVAAGYQGFSKYLLKYMNNGSGGFSSAEIFGEEVGFCSLALGDINADGYLDLVTSGEDSRLDRYMNDGTGNFAGPFSFGTGVDRSSIALGDINNDGKLDLVVSGSNNTEGYVLKSYLNSGGSFVQETSVGKGVHRGSLVLGDVDNDGDLDLLVTGNAFSNNYFHQYINLDSETNDPPNAAPAGLATTDVNGYWRLNWNAPADDYTASSLMQYHVAIGISNSGTYNLISTNIDYPRGQPLVGNVPVAYSNFYQTRIPVYYSIYWKVCAIDTSFKHGPFSAESSKITNAPHFLNVTTNVTISGTNLNTLNFLLMSINIVDSSNYNLTSIKISNAGSMRTTDISAVKLWDDSNNNFIWDEEDLFVTNLYWTGTYWSNGNKSYNLTPAGKNFILTADLSTTVQNYSNFLAVIPAGGVLSYGTNAPSAALFNGDYVYFKYSFILNLLWDFPGGFNAATVVMGDINSDGWIDMIVSGYNGGKILYKYINDGDGTFTGPAGVGGTGTDRGDIVLADFNNNGHLDIVWTGEAGGPVSIYIMTNNGAGTFGNQRVVGPNLTDGALISGDIDNDGDMDMAWVNAKITAPTTATWARNDGGLTFTLINISTDGHFV
ncbi:MAG: VCBS repeat-containing protein, partial [Spirochaetes bacterium]|nr:VCBS repeat-containing protein [Spirochaetota bacterium]